MVDFLGVSDHGQQRKGGFDNHPVVPGALFADLDIGRHTVGTTKAPVGQNHCLTIIFLKEVQEILVCAVHFVPNPATYLTAAVEHPTQLDAHTPAPFVAAFGPELLLGAALANGKNQFYRVAVRHIQHTRLFQQRIGQVLMGVQLPHQVGAIRQTSKQRLKVAFEPPIEGSKPATFEGKQNADGHHFTRIQFGTWLFLDWTQAIVDMVKNVNDNQGVRLLERVAYLNVTLS